MAEQKKNTHVAVHAIVFNDEKGNSVEIAPGTEFAPNKNDVADLEARGAIRKVAKVEVEADETDSKDGKK